MLNSIAVCDSEKSKINLHHLLDELLIDKLILFEEISTDELEKFKLIMFILDSSNIGSKFFVDKIKNIVEERKNTKSIHFVIDGIEKLSKIEIFKLKLELEKALDDVIENPKISILSSTLASVSRKYYINLINIEDIKKNKSIIYEDDYGFPISSNDITKEHISKFREKSNIDEISKSIELDLKCLESVNLKKKCCSVLGIENSGKTSLIRILETKYNDIEFLECKSIKNININITEVVLIVLSNIHERNKEFLNEIKYDLNDCKVIVLSNKTDEYMYEDEDISLFKENIKGYVQDTLNTDVIFTSAYYTEKWLELESEKINIEDLRNDENIIVYDKYNMPIVNFNSDKDLIKCFQKQNYINEIEMVVNLL